MMMHLIEALNGLLSAPMVWFVDVCVVSSPGLRDQCEEGHIHTIPIPNP
jgi:hypothetical protein